MLYSMELQHQYVILPLDRPTHLVELAEFDFTEKGFAHRRGMLGWARYNDAQYVERCRKLTLSLLERHNPDEIYELINKINKTTTPIYVKVLCFYDLEQYAGKLATQRAYERTLLFSEARLNALREQRARLWEIYTKQEKANWRGRFKRAELDYKDRLKTEREHYEKVQICEYNVSLWRKHLTA